ncbi:MAG: hypothetical protein AAB403_06450, partial [Planctomycetota bacterium]
PLPDGSSAGMAFACYSRLNARVPTTRVKVAGPPLILQGYIPAGAPGGAWSKVQIGLPPDPQPRTPSVTGHVEQMLRGGRIPSRQGAVPGKR